MREINAHTRLLCLIGSPIGHSFSPTMHNAAIEELGLDYAYLAFDIKENEIDQTVKSLKLLNARGWNITMPLKSVMCNYVDKLTLASQISGSCNTVVNDNGYLTGYTTDGIGFMKAVEKANVNIIGEKITILGAGGAGSAILVQAALDGVKEINVFNRQGKNFEKIKEISKKLNEVSSCKVNLNDYDNPNILKEKIAESKVLVNATPLGMAPNIDACPISDFTMLHKDLLVYDVIYNPKETVFLKKAKEMGLKTANGLDMLLYQGAASFKLWTGEDMPVEHIKEKYFTNK